ncbi:hypothetical protein L9F63_008966 [Diploptera punctata]|uniref:Uncharacterized protein n=1 Tax=Diploptera punctata TaxID=6984 RepID=A0AAD8E0Y4_DIPPU|nr:hypothetical protein L9F63_008966 [Diploptera punctata]
MNKNRETMEIQMFMAEEEILKRSIIELEKKVAHKHDTLILTEIANSNSRTDITSTKNSSSLRRWLKISEKLNKVKFVNEEINLLHDGGSECVADGVAGSIQFHISLKFHNYDGQELVIDSLRVKLEDKFQENEIKSWLNVCMRHKDVQTLVRGIYSYEQWFSNRNYIVQSLRGADYGTYYTVEKSLDDGEMNIIARLKPRAQPLFTCKWSIMWNRASSSMSPSFVFCLSNRTRFFKENEYAFKILNSLNVTPQEVKEMWNRISLSLTVSSESETESES